MDMDYLSELENDNSELRSENVYLQQLVDELEEENSDLSCELESYEEELADRDTDYDQLEFDNNELQDKIDELSNKDSGTLSEVFNELISIKNDGLIDSNTFITLCNQLTLKFSYSYPIAGYDY